MGTRKVVVQGDGNNLYKVSELDGWFYVYQVAVSLFSNSNNNIGKTRSLEDALALIKSYSGKEIRKISGW